MADGVGLGNDAMPAERLPADCEPSPVRQTLRARRSAHEALSPNRGSPARQPTGRGKLPGVRKGGMYEIVLAGGVFVWIMLAAVYARSGVASIYHPVTYYLFFHGFIFVFRPIVAFYSNFQAIYNLYEFNPSLGEKSTVILGANLAAICFVTVCLRTGRVPLRLYPTFGSQQDTQRSHLPVLLLTALLLAPIGIYAQRYALTFRGADSGMIRDAATGATINTSTNGYLTGATDFLGALCVLLAWQMRFRLLSLLPFLAYVTARSAVGGGRWSFLLTSASLLLLYLYDRRKLWPTPTTIAIGVVMLALFILVGQNRDIVYDYLNGYHTQQDLIRENLLEGMDYANLEYYEYLVWVIPHKTGTWGYFLDNLQVFTEPVPRILWPGKPVGPPIQFWSLFDYGNPIGMTLSLPGEGWAQGGYIGITLWASLAGALCGYCYKLFARSRQTAFQVGLYMLIAPIFVQIFRDGVLISALKFPMFFVTTVLVWWGLAKVLERRPMRPLLRA